MFSWDPAKDRANLAKHGVGFDAAQLVFMDPFHVSRLDRIEDGEQRWQTLGVAGGVLLLLVAHTWRQVSEEQGDEHIRIISARRATKAERKIYERGA